jgi:hypothetical protein
MLLSSHLLIYCALFLLLFEFSTALSCKVEQFSNKCWRIRGAPHATMGVTRDGEVALNSDPAAHLLRRCHLMWGQHGTFLVAMFCLMKMTTWRLLPYGYWSCLQLNFYCVSAFTCSKHAAAQIMHWVVGLRNCILPWSLCEYGNKPYWASEIFPEILVYESGGGGFL